MRFELLLKSTLLTIFVLLSAKTLFGATREQWEARISAARDVREVESITRQMELDLYYEVRTNQIVLTNVATTAVVARAQLFASLRSDTNVLAILQITGPAPDAVEEYLKTHLVPSTTREIFRSMRDIWADLAPWCPDGTVASFTSTIRTTNYVVELMRRQEP
jgi:hypothetical protein